MDTVDFVLSILAVLLLGNIGTALLAWGWWRAARKAQQEVVMLVARQRYAASYDTGLRETPIVQVLDAS